MQKFFVFFIVATSLAIGASFAQAATDVAGNSRADIKGGLKLGEGNRRVANPHANTAQNPVWGPETVALITIGLIGLGLKRRQQT